MCQFAGVKKRKVTTLVCVFLRKAPTKKLHGLDGAIYDQSMINPVMVGKPGSLKATKYRSSIVSLVQNTWISVIGK